MIIRVTENITPGDAERPHHAGRSKRMAQIHQDFKGTKVAPNKFQ